MKKKESADESGRGKWWRLISENRRKYVLTFHKRKKEGHVELYRWENYFDTLFLAKSTKNMYLLKLSNSKGVLNNYVIRIN